MKNIFGDPNSKPRSVVTLGSSDLYFLFQKDFNLLNCNPSLISGIIVLVWFARIVVTTRSWNSFNLNAAVFARVLKNKKWKWEQNFYTMHTETWKTSKINNFSTLIWCFSIPWYFWVFTADAGLHSFLHATIGKVPKNRKKSIKEKDFEDKKREQLWKISKINEIWRKRLRKNFGNPFFGIFGDSQKIKKIESSKMWKSDPQTMNIYRGIPKKGVKHHFWTTWIILENLFFWPSVGELEWKK